MSLIWWGVVLCTGCLVVMLLVGLWLVRTAQHAAPGARCADDGQSNGRPEGQLDGRIAVQSGGQAGGQTGGQEAVEMLARLCHELSTPLSSVAGNLDLLLADDGLGSQQRMRLETARRNAVRLTEMLSNARATSGLSVASVEQRFSECNLRGIVEDRLAAVEAGLSARSLTIGVEATEAELLVLGDGLQLGQVVDVLLSNAVKYTQAGGWIDLGLRRGVGEAVVLTCSNSGQTLAQEEIARAFVTGYRSSAAVDSGTPGSGLGLGIARGIVEGHGGSFQFTVWPDRGVTSVQVELPACPRAAKPAAATSGPGTQAKH